MSTPEKPSTKITVSNPNTEAYMYAPPLPANEDTSPGPLWDAGFAEGVKATEEKYGALHNVAEHVVRKVPEAIARLRKHKFVFARAPSDAVQRVAELSDGERWEHLAFSLYTDIAELSQEAESALEDLRQVEAKP